MADAIELLQAHRTIGVVPRAELEWLVAHGSVRHYEIGAMVARKGEPVDGLYIILSGRISHLTDQGGGWRKVLEWRGGDVTGVLPYSRMAGAPGNSRVDEPTEVFRVPSEHIPAMMAACPEVTAALVHVMVDRARMFKTSDLQLERMASLGKLAAGLAHELNNPASAAARSAQLLSAALAESDDAARAIGAERLDANALSLVEKLRSLCVSTASASVLTPLERADREEELGDWLTAHGTNESLAASFAETDVKMPELEQLATALHGESLHAALRWVAAGCTVRALARDIERAASRVHVLVSSVKGFTYMDHATTPEPVDLAKGLTDTIAVMAAKARGKSASLTSEVPRDIPRVNGFGGELNQVWANLLDNALDAVKDGGRVKVAASVEGPSVVVRVSDDGHGIPKDVMSRIFDPFFTTKPVGQGTGLGLDIVRRLVERNDGLMEVHSEPGHTEFKITLKTIA